MGFGSMLDSLLGRSRLPKAKLDRLFAISTAWVTMQVDLEMRPSRSAGLCFKPMESSHYTKTRQEIEELLEYSCRETGTGFKLEKDEYNFLWAILEDPDFEDLVTNIHLVSQTLVEKGLGELLLCAIYRFEGQRPIYWIYNFKQASYYPFIPTGKGQRDNSMEFRLRTLMDKELPIEKNVEKWYPLWGIPF